jgi:glycosyltransferase involved in cell wall biosynthesis
MKQEISVIIPSYNSATFVADAIDSVLKQTVPPLEVIVVDDGSTDDTGEVLGRFDRHIRRIRFAENRGVSVARNRGIALARGNLIAFLDADDVWFPGKLERQLACLADHPEAGLVHSDVIHWDMSTGQEYFRECGRHEFAGSCYHQFLMQNRVLPSTMIVRRECLARVGGFDEAIRRPTAQDYELCFRIAKHYEFAFVDEPLILYRHHESNATRQDLAMREDELFVVRKAIRLDPDMVRILGSKTVKDRLFALLFDIGYSYHSSYRCAKARRYFREALCIRPGNAYAWLLFLVNHLPSTWLRMLKETKGPTAMARPPRPVRGN